MIERCPRFGMNKKVRFRQPICYVVFGFLAALFSAAAPAQCSTPSQAAAGQSVCDRVDGNLILLNDNGAWSWYQDERAIVDPQAGTLLVSSVAASPRGIDGRRDGNVDLTTFDFSSGLRTRFVLGEIQEDDHNSAALLKRPDGRYLAVYANHNTDRVSRYRVSLRPLDASAWTPERHFDWQTTPGNDFNVTYSNLFYLSAEKRVYNFARVNDRSPNMMLSMDQGDSWTYGGQLTRSEDVGYVNGYFKYASNGVGRIHLIATEAHPRDYNNGIYHAYIEGEKLFGADGTLIDEDIHDNKGTPPTKSLTPVFLPDEEDGTQKRHRAWTTDIALDRAGRPYALFTIRAGDAVPSPDGTGDDRRLYYARFDGDKWIHHDVAKMGRRLFRSEQDYTGLGALVPGDPNTIYISSTFNPATEEETPYHEIYKGQTDDGGRNWQWTSVTTESTVDNLRPIIPAPHGGHLAVLWFRGTMSRSQAYDTSIVGIIDRRGETVGRVRYFDARTDNTRQATGEMPAVGQLKGWKEREGVGINNTVFVPDGGGVEEPRLLVTELSGLGAGTFDLFAFFWGTPEGKAQLRASLKPEALLTFSQRDSQAAEKEQIEPGQDVAIHAGQSQLHRAYVGRVQVEGDARVSVFISGSDMEAASPTRYDGLGYARVEASRGSEP